VAGHRIFSGDRPARVKEPFVTSTMDLPTQRDTDEPMTTPDTELTSSDLDGVATDHTTADDTSSHEVEDTPLDELSDEDRAALHTQWDAEVDTIIWADPHEVLLAENVRTDNAEADKETTANFKTHGVKTAANGYRDYDTGAIVVTEGQRRVLNSREAGCKVPVWMKTPPAADERKATIERIVNQFIENDIRVGLTLGDKARGFQQLAAFNLTPTGIARKLALGKKGKTYVENVLQAGRSELAVKAAERFQLDLLQVAVIAEFDEAGDLDTAKELIRIAREAPNNFAMVAERKRAERAENERFAALTEDLTEELTTAGVTIFDASLSDHDGDARSLDRLRPTPEHDPRTELTADDHASCPGHGAWIEEEYDEDNTRIPVAVYGCADFRTHGHALSYAPTGRIDFTPLVTGPTSASTSGEAVDLDNPAAASGNDEIAAARAAQAAAELERQKARIIRKWVIQNNKDWDASEAPRREWLASLVQRNTAPPGAQLFLALQKAHGGYELRRAFERNHPLAMKVFGLPVGATLADLTAKIAKAPTAGKATLYDLVLTLCAIEDDISRNTWRSPWGSSQAYMAALISWKYPASDVERKVLAPETEQDVIAAQLGNLDTAATSDGGETADGDDAGELHTEQPGEDTDTDTTGDDDCDGNGEPDQVDHQDFAADSDDDVTGVVDDDDAPGTDDQSGTGTTADDDLGQPNDEVAAELAGAAI
jgi:ParB family chromosome partitioning protein